MRCPKCGHTLIEPPFCSIAVEHECAICDYKAFKPGYSQGEYRMNQLTCRINTIGEIKPKCDVPGCNRTVHEGRLCETHHSYWCVAGKPDKDEFIEQMWNGETPEQVKRLFHCST